MSGRKFCVIAFLVLFLKLVAPQCSDEGCECEEKKICTNNFSGYSCSEGGINIVNNCIECTEFVCHKDCCPQDHPPSGSSSPKACPVGHYCPISEDSPIPCPEGTYNPNIGSEYLWQCDHCPDGTFNDQTGQSSESACKECPIDHYCPSQSSSPIPCPEGTSNDKKGQDMCIDQRVVLSISSDEDFQSIAVLPDGTLASGSYDNTIKIWNTNTGQTIRTLKGHNSRVYSLVVLPDGKLASGSDDETIKIWNTETGQNIRTLTGHSSDIEALVVLPDGRLASGSDDETIKIWNTETGQLIRTLTGHSDVVRSLVVFPDGRLASGSRDNTIKIWNAETGQEIHEIKESAYVFSFAILPNGNLVTAFSDLTIKVWDTSNWSSVKNWKLESKDHDNGGPSFDVGSRVTLSVLPDGTLVVSQENHVAHGMQEIYIKEEGHETTLYSNGTVWEMDVLPDGKLVSMTRNLIQIWKPQKTYSQCSAGCEKNNIEGGRCDFFCFVPQCKFDREICEPEPESELQLGSSMSVRENIFLFLFLFLAFF